MRSHRARLSGVAAIALLLAGPAAAQSPSPIGYHVSHADTLGGDGRWDYLTLDTTDRRLFIARQTRVMVVDPDTGDSLGVIPGITGAHGIALAEAAGHGFATGGRDSSVTMFDLRSLAILKRVRVGDDADAVLYDPASRRVFTFNGDAGTSTAVDAVTGAVIGTVPLGGKPEFGVSDGAGRLYVNIEDKAEVAEIDPVRLRVTRRWALAPCEEPTGLAIDRTHHLLFSGCHNRTMAISDGKAGRTVAQVPIGEGVDGAAFDPGTGLAFASNGDGTLTIVHEDSPTAFHVVSTVSTQRGARTLTLDGRRHRVYTVTATLGPTPAASEAEPRPRPSLVPGTFVLLTIDP
ncbi:MAG: YncE family protein [Gemmatimonadales bacterium]